MTSTTRTKPLSMRQIAQELGITPAYLSYMVNGKRPWRPDLYGQYTRLVNSANVNSRQNGPSSLIRTNVLYSARRGSGVQVPSAPPTWTVGKTLARTFEMTFVLDIGFPVRLVYH